MQKENEPDEVASNELALAIPGKAAALPVGDIMEVTPENTVPQVSGGTLEVIEGERKRRKTFQLLESDPTTKFIDAQSLNGPMYTWKEEDFPKGSDIRARVRHAKSSKKYHLNSKLLSELVEENLLLRRHVSKLRAKVMELSQCGCEGNSDRILLTSPQYPASSTAGVPNPQPDSLLQLTPQAAQLLRMVRPLINISAANRLAINSKPQSEFQPSNRLAINCKPQSEFQPSFWGGTVASRIVYAKKPGSTYKNAKAFSDQFFVEMALMASEETARRGGNISLFTQASSSVSGKQLTCSLEENSMMQEMCKQFHGKDCKGFVGKQDLGREN